MTVYAKPKIDTFADIRNGQTVRFALSYCKHRSVKVRAKEERGGSILYHFVVSSFMVPSNISYYVVSSAHPAHNKIKDK